MEHCHALLSVLREPHQFFAARHLPTRTPDAFVVFSDDRVGDSVR